MGHEGDLGCDLRLGLEDYRGILALVGWKATEGGRGALWEKFRRQLLQFSWLQWNNTKFLSHLLGDSDKGVRYLAL